METQMALTKTLQPNGESLETGGVTYPIDIEYWWPTRPRFVMYKYPDRGPVKLKSVKIEREDKGHGDC